MSEPHTTVEVTQEGIDVRLYDDDGVEVGTRHIPWADCIGSEKAWSVFSEVVQDDVEQTRTTVRGSAKPFESIDDTKYGSLVDNG